MTTTRQDAWTQDEDLLLAEVVLRHIREGGTQLSAFEEVGRRLSRTAAACGFRWNSYVRKQYKSGIELAKKQRKNSKKDTNTNENNSEAPVPIVTAKVQEDLDTPSLRKVITILEEYEQSQQKYEQLEQENKVLQELVLKLEEINEQYEQEKETLANNLEVIEEAYKALIEVMERARKMVVLQEDEKSRKLKLQVDINGNFERIEK
ncbi:RsfA family transcriptional regulator [Cytobacillus sp. S13-E01]|uniref:RsfA family transcriptional regulator n=1 Tax=Cytobacillus sp. S13-E01 TaxID=3031326 RepID=UPI0023D88DC0|nr:RsfA family transcriptional regulator [Cytobacillus sp. S13-E01]MDF0725295.1 RsfA family transcriptional regulator [Cytobacillus sp. S13-E01]